MPEFRTASGLVATSAYMRTVAGLVPCAPVFYGASGPVDTGGAGDELTVAPDVLSVSGAVATNAHVGVSTNVVTVTIAGGKAPYSVLWTPDVGGWTIANPAALSTYFRSGNLGPGDSDSNTFTCTATDSSTPPLTATCDVPANVDNFGS